MIRSTRTLRLACVAVAVLAPLASLAQNVTTVNGKPVPKARVEALLSQVQRNAQGQAPERSPALEARAREEVVLREIFTQEAEKLRLSTTPSYKSQMELMRQSILIRELFEDFKKKNPVSEAESRAEYDKFKAQASGTEYKARHILVDNEDEAKKLITQIKGGAKFEELAKKSSKDTGSGQNGGDLDFAKPDSYVPEFSKAMVALKKGDMTETPVKTQFGYHIIQLQDTREAQFPEFDAVKPQIEQRLAQNKLQKYQEDLRKAAKTDFKFSAQQ